MANKKTPVTAESTAEPVVSAPKKTFREVMAGLKSQAAALAESKPTEGGSVETITISRFCEEIGMRPSHMAAFVKICEQNGIKPRGPQSVFPKSNLNALYRAHYGIKA